MVWKMNAEGVISGNDVYAVLCKFVGHDGHRGQKQGFHISVYTRRVPKAIELC